MRCIQNIIISAPKDGNELRDLLYTATLNTTKPFTIRYPKEQSVKFEKNPPQKIEIGTWEVLNKGNDLLILSVGSMVNKSLEIHSMLLEKGISSEIVNCRFIKPMDENYLNESLQNIN